MDLAAAVRQDRIERRAAGGQRTLSLALEPHL